MQLWAWRTAQSMVEASHLRTEDELPTPYQLSLLIGILLASPDKMRRYLSYRFFRQPRIGAPLPPACKSLWYLSYRCFRQQRKEAPRSPKLLKQAGLMLCLCFLMAA